MATFSSKINYTPAKANYSSLRSSGPAYSPPQRTGSVLGASTSAQFSPTPIGPPGAPAGYKPSSGVGVPQGGGMPQQNIPQNMFQQQPDQPSIDYDSMIAPALQALDQSIAPLEQGYQEQLGGIESGRQTRIAGQKAALGEAETAGTASRQRVTGQTESAIDEARRQYSELQQGLQSRYGGTTGTGKFVGEIAGSQTMRNIAGFRQGLTQAMTEIDNSIEKVRTATQIAIQDIEDKTAEDKRLAKQQLDQSLNQIRLAKGELQGRKSELATQALQFYQQQVQQVNASNAAFKQQLFLRQQEAEQQLALARQRGAETAQKLSLVNLQTGKDTYQPVTFNPQSGEVTQVPGMGGQLDPNKEEDIFAGL